MYKIIKNKIKSIINFFYGFYFFLKFLVFDKKKIRDADIVCFFPYYHTGGAEKVHLNIVKALGPKKVCVIFTLNSATKNFQEQFIANAACIEINPILNKRNMLINKLLHKSICNTVNTSKSCKVVFGCNANYFYQILPFLNDKISRIDLFHNFFENDNREKMIVDSAFLIDQRIVINQAAKQDIIKFYKKNNVDSINHQKITIIENGIEIDTQKYSKKEAADFKIGFLGRWCFEKRPLLFLEIAKMVNGKYPKVSFVMAGTGMTGNLDAISAAGVEFLGEITDKIMLNQLYKELDVILLPSLYEGFPLVIMEAMSNGVISISTKLEGICEHIVNDYNGLLIKDSDESKIVKNFSISIFKLIEDSNYRNKLSYNSYIYAQEHFNIEKFNASYRKLLT